jgi:hypothetical protein
MLDLVTLVRQFPCAPRRLPGAVSGINVNQQAVQAEPYDPSLTAQLQSGLVIIVTGDLRLALARAVAQRELEHQAGIPTQIIVAFEEIADRVAVTALVVALSRGNRGHLDHIRLGRGIGVGDDKTGHHRHRLGIGVSRQAGQRNAGVEVKLGEQLVLTLPGGNFHIVKVQIKSFQSIIPVHRCFQKPGGIGLIAVHRGLVNRDYGRVEQFLFALKIKELLEVVLARP